MSTTDIMQCAFERLKTFCYLPEAPILWPGIQSDPPDEGMWLEPGYFPNEPIDFAWDNDACVETRGFFQILVYYRPGIGQMEPSRIADALIEHFPKGLELNSVRVRKRPWQSPSVTEKGKSFIPVTVAYHGLT